MGKLPFVNAQLKCLAFSLDCPEPQHWNVTLGLILTVYVTPEHSGWRMCMHIAHQSQGGSVLGFIIELLRERTLPFLRNLNLGGYKLELLQTLSNLSENTDSILGD